MSDPADAPAAAALGVALANQIGRLVAEFTGHGASRSHAFIHQNTVVCVLEDGASKGERNLIAAGRGEIARAHRDALHRAMEAQLVACVERLTGRTVRTFLPATSTRGDTSVEVFILEPPLAAASA